MLVGLRPGSDPTDGEVATFPTTQGPEDAGTTLCGDTT